MDKRGLKVFLRKLDLIDGEYVLFGGSCLAIRGLRDLNDVDLFVTKRLYKLLTARGWQEKSEPGGAPYLTTRIAGVTIDAVADWLGDGWQPNIQSYLRHPEIIDGLRFMPLKDLYEWKKATRRPKDIIDMSLIEKYWAHYPEAH
jgi:hypothetical protein